MSVERKVRKDGVVSWQVRWRDGGRGSRTRARTFHRKADAVAFDDEVRRRRRLGELVGFASAQETLNHYVAETWAKTHGVTLSAKTAKCARSFRRRRPSLRTRLAELLRRGFPPGARVSCKSWFPCCCGATPTSLWSPATVWAGRLGFV